MYSKRPESCIDECQSCFYMDLCNGKPFSKVFKYPICFQCFSFYMRVQFYNLAEIRYNETGTRQCTRAVWSTFAEIGVTGTSGLNLWLVTHHNTYETYLIYPDLWKHLVFRLLLLLFRLVGLSVEAKDDWTFSRCFQRMSFCSRVYMYVHGMRYLYHEVQGLDGYNHEFWKTSGYSLKCVSS